MVSAHGRVVATRTVAVSLIARVVAPLGRQISTAACRVALVGLAVALVGVAVALAGRVVARIAGGVAALAGLIALFAGLVAAMADTAPPAAGLVGRSRRFTVAESPRIRDGPALFDLPAAHGVPEMIA